MTGCRDTRIGKNIKNAPENGNFYHLYPYGTLTSEIKDRETNDWSRISLKKDGQWQLLRTPTNKPKNDIPLL